VYSKLMCWVAVDRDLGLADKRSFPDDRDRWLKVQRLGTLASALRTSISRDTGPIALRTDYRFSPFG
jgi:hypothetical protein